MSSKDQRSIDEPTSYEKWDRAKSILLESLLKPDHHLRSCAHNQHCYDDVIQIRDQIVEYVQEMTNPRPYIDPDSNEPKTYEYAAHITLSDIARFQKGHSL